MNNVNKILKRLSDSKSLMDVVIQMESFLDDLDIYVFKNWFDGEVVEGPNIRRHWVSIILEYPYENMPDPEGGLRLIKHGARVKYSKAKREVPVKIESPSDYQDGSVKPKMKELPVWLVEIQIPRRFIEELSDSDLELYGDDIDADSVSDARDEGIDADSMTKESDDSGDDDEGDDEGEDLDLDLGGDEEEEE